MTSVTTPHINFQLAFVQLRQEKEAGDALKQEIIQLASAYQQGELRAVLLLPTSQEPCRLLTLLHGAQETPETILKNSDLVSLAERLRLAVLLPALGNSFCLDWGPGQNARSALLRDLLPAAQERSGVSAAREANVIGGISMGGFGAVSLALCERERFCAAFSLSGALDLKKAAQLFRICQLSPPGDLCAAAARPEAHWDALLTRDAVKPALYLTWGDQDWFREANRSFARQAAEQGSSLQTAEKPGLHNWTYWKTSLPPALEWAAGI